MVLEKCWVAAAATKAEPHEKKVETEEYVCESYEAPPYCHAYCVWEYTCLSGLTRYGECLK